MKLLLLGLGLLWIGLIIRLLTFIRLKLKQRRQVNECFRRSVQAYRHGNYGMFEHWRKQHDELGRKMNNLK